MRVNMKRIALCCSVLAALGLTAAHADEPISIESLLTEMVDRDAVARFPQPDFRLRQQSSYDRLSKTPGKLILHATRSYDYGTLRITVNGRPAGAEIDLYADRPIPSGPIELGVFEPTENGFTLRAEVTGSNSNSRGTYFALDCVVTVPTKKSQVLPALEVLPVSVVQAWEAAGFQVGWMRENAVGAPVFNVGEQSVPGDVPAFRLRRHSRRPMEGLPSPTTTFGLSFHKIGIGNEALQDLPVMNKLCMLDVTMSAVTDEGLSYLSGLRNLRVLSLDDTPVTTAGLRHIAGLPNLRSLQLSECWELTDDSFQQIAKLKSLQRLRFWGVDEFTDTNAKHLVGLPNLEELYLERTNITDAGLEYVSRISSLRKLDLWLTKVTDEGLKHLAALEKLESLRLWETPITGTGFAHLTELNNLHSVDLSKTALNDAGLRQVGRLRSLHSLSLLATQITDAGLGHLAEQKELRSLGLSSTNVSDAGLSHLAGLENLQGLGLHKTKVTDAGLQHLAGLRHLRRLFVSGGQVTDAGVKKLQESLPACTTRWPKLKVRVIDQEGLAIAGAEVLVYRDEDSSSAYPKRHKTDDQGLAWVYSVWDSFCIRLAPREGKYGTESIAVRRSDDGTAWKAGRDDPYVQVTTLKDNDVSVVVTLP